MKKILARVDTFFFTPASPLPLAILRISLAIVLLLQALSLRGFALDLLANDGIVQGDLAAYFAEPGAPRLSWITAARASWGVPETMAIHGVCALYLLSLVLLFAGLFTRPTAVAAWLLHWTLLNSSESTSYGIDAYAHVFLFYLIWVPSGDALSLDVRLALRKGGPSVPARLGLRVLQLQLCITYFCSALEKAAGPQWWNGELLWRALNLPIYLQFDMTWLAHWPLLLKTAGWASLALEGLYWLFIWPRHTRPLWIAGIVGMHLGIAVFLGLQRFGLIMCVLTLSLFAVSAEPAAGRRLAFSWSNPCTEIS